MSKKYPGVCPEVADFLAREDKVAKFRADNYELFRAYGQLIEERNAARDKADKVVRATGEAQGPWQVHRRTIEIDAEVLYTRVGGAKFQRLGGSIETKHVYSVDKKAFEAAIGLKMVPEKVVEEVYKEKVAWSAPKELGV